MNRSLLRIGSFAVKWSLHHLDNIVHRPNIVRCFSASSVHYFLDARDKDHVEKSKQLIVHQGEYFDKVSQHERNKQTFEKALGLYLKQNAIYRRGHVEFLYAALDRMTEFDVHRDLATYKELLTLFPEGKMIAGGPWDVEWMYYPKQQQCCIDIMDMMEMNGKFYLLLVTDLYVRLFALVSSLTSLLFHAGQAAIKLCSAEASKRANAHPQDSIHLT